MTLRTHDFLSLARLAAHCCSDKKAEDIRLLDVRRISGLADFYLMASVTSSPHLQAVQEHIDRHVKQEYGVDPLHRDGVSSAQWAVLDYGGVVIHVMHNAARSFYGLERLWEGARVVQWERPSPPLPSKKERSKNRRRQQGRQRR